MLDGSWTRGPGQEQVCTIKGDVITWNKDAGREEASMKFTIEKNVLNMGENELAAFMPGLPSQLRWHNGAVWSREASRRETSDAGNKLEYSITKTDGTCSVCAASIKKDEFVGKCDEESPAFWVCSLCASKAHVLRSVELGATVRRGPDWVMHLADGGKLGIVTGSTEPGTVTVKWISNGCEFVHRIGQDNKYDLIVATEEFEVGDRVRCRGSNGGWQEGVIISPNPLRAMLDGERLAECYPEIHSISEEVSKKQGFFKKLRNGIPPAYKWNQEGLDDDNYGFAEPFLDYRFFPTLDFKYALLSLPIMCMFILIGMMILCRILIRVVVVPRLQAMDGRSYMPGTIGKVEKRVLSGFTALLGICSFLTIMICAYIAHEEIMGGDEESEGSS